MGLNRRTFLQKAGLGLAALGVSETVLSLLGDQSLAVPTLERYFQVLAQPSGRKLALLVGINQYPNSTALGGCVTDVELQRELLIYRFGFNPRDILTLTDSQATRENIEAAFLDHLTEQAKAGDVVVFHFSGYGSRITIDGKPQPDKPVLIQNGLVPFDGILPTKGAAVANDLLENTLSLLLRSLPTEYVTTVLDTSYTGSGMVLQGNLRVRSCPNAPAEAPTPEELAFQETILRRLKDSGRLRSNAETLNQMPGIVLAAAGPSQPATEALWNGFSAGLFTYALTQNLWQASPTTTVQVSVSRAAGMVNQLVGKEQQPRLMGQKVLQQPLLAYYLPPDPSLGADGVVTAIEENGKTAQIWLAGLPATVLEYYGINSLLSLSPSSLRPSGTENKEQVTGQNSAQSPIPNPPQLQLRTKEGLSAKARIVSTNPTENYQLQVGQLVRESVRVLPRNLGLTVALDAGLERIERVDATSAFANIPAVSSVVVAGEQPADYLFGRVPDRRGADFSPIASSYGLFYLAREPIHNTTGEAGEAVKLAVNRLAPKLKTLLAAKLLRLTANEGSSRLGLRASLETVAPDKVVMQRETLRASSSSVALVGKKTDRDLTPGVEGSIPTLPIGSHIQYRLENYSDRPIYFMLLGWDSTGNAIALYDSQSFQETETIESKPPLKHSAIAPGETLLVPESAASFDWIVSGPAGLAEIQIICSRAPFKKAIAALDAARRAARGGTRVGDLFNPLDVAQAVLQDLHNASAMVMARTLSYTPDSSPSTVSDTYALDVNAWATLSFIYQVA